MANKAGRSGGLLWRPLATTGKIVLSIGIKAQSGSQPRLVVRHTHTHTHTYVHRCAHTYVVHTYIHTHVHVCNYKYLLLLLSRSESGSGTGCGSGRRAGSGPGAAEVACHGEIRALDASVEKSTRAANATRRVATKCASSDTHTHTSTHTYVQHTSTHTNTHASVCHICEKYNNSRFMVRNNYSAINSIASGHGFTF